MLSSPSPAVRPVHRTKRIQSIDVIRGVALLGLLDWEVLSHFSNFPNSITTFSP